MVSQRRFSSDPRGYSTSRPVSLVGCCALWLLGVRELALSHSLYLYSSIKTIREPPFWIFSTNCCLGERSSRAHAGVGQQDHDHCRISKSFRFYKTKNLSGTLGTGPWVLLGEGLRGCVSPKSPEGRTPYEERAPGIKPNETKRNETKRNETKRNETKRGEEGRERRWTWPCYKRC